MSIALGIAAILASSRALAAPSVEIQNLEWIAPAELPGSLATYQAEIDAAMREARRLLQGDQGPADVPCCVDLRRIAIQEPSAPSLVTIDAAADYETMTQLCESAGGGSCAFLTSSITWCGGPGVGIAGCADRPACNENAPNDDPTLVLVVSLASLEDGTFAQTLAHERGHNACLAHVPSASNPSANPCNLMQVQAGGGCLSATECSRYRDAGNAEQGSCACQDDALATANDGGACSDVASGACSGGVCVPRADASVRLLAAGGPEAATGAVTDEPLRVAAGSGGWSDAGSFDAEIRALEEAPSRGRVYGITAADELVSIDPDTGARLATIGGLPATASFSLPSSGMQPALYESLAFDPGASASPGDDRLYALRLAAACPYDEFCDVELVSIDPDDATTLARGPLTQLYPGTRHGLAFDSARGALYTVIPFLGLYEIDPACVGTAGCFGCCEAADTGVDLIRSDAALAYEATTDRLYAIGTDPGGSAAFDVIDAGTLIASPSVGIDGFTPGGLAAPEPGASGVGFASLASLALSAASRRIRRRQGRAARRSC